MILVLTEGSERDPATGGVLRVQGLVRGLHEVGVPAEVTHVPRRPGPLSVRHAGLARASAMTTLLAGRTPTAVLVCGLPLAPAARGLRRLGIPVVVDLCDSWDRLRDTPSGLRGRLARRSIRTAMRAYVAAADAVTYVAARDRDWDVGEFSWLPRTAVVPNGISSALLDGPDDDGGGEGGLVWPADWGYGPNVEALRWLVEEVLPLCSGLPELRLFGPAPPPPEVTLPPGVRFVGFAESLRCLYGGAAAVVAPALSGGGVKNKVLEAIASGTPVVTTPEGVAGLPEEVAGLALVASEPAEFARLLTHALAPEAARRARASRAACRTMTWEASGRLLSELAWDVTAR